MTHLDLGSQTHPNEIQPTNIYTRFGKRAFDLCLAAVLLPLVTPIILLLCLTVRSRNAPSLFGHLRVGKDGQTFKCWKIRTMVPNAEDLLAAHLDATPKAAAEWAHAQKLANDPRVTRIGRFLRRTSLDELPQIWNVLRGQMSFVGPRPVTQEELTRYGLHVQTYLALTPGITGQWQTQGRSNGCYIERLSLDVDYAQRVSFWRDLVLLFATGMVVLSPNGR